MRRSGINAMENLVRGSIEEKAIRYLKTGEWLRDRNGAVDLIKDLLELVGRLRRGELELAKLRHKIEHDVHDREVLVLGNGISRLRYQFFIDNWKGELWICNRAYHDFPHADRLCGHKAILREAHGYNFKGEIWTNISRWVRKMGDEFPEYMKDFTTETGLVKQHQMDAGTTLVACAVHEGYRRVFVCGFDLGGADVYWEGHKHSKRKYWLERWRQISIKLGLERVFFIGKDWKPFLLNFDRSYNEIAPLVVKGGHVLENRRLLIYANNGKDIVEYIKAMTSAPSLIWVVGDCFLGGGVRRLNIDRILVLNMEKAKEAEDLFPEAEIYCLERSEEYREFYTVHEDKPLIYHVVEQAMLEGFKAINMVGEKDCYDACMGLDEKYKIGYSVLYKEDK